MTAAPGPTGPRPVVPPTPSLSGSAAPQAVSAPASKNNPTWLPPLEKAKVPVCLTKTYGSSLDKKTLLPLLEGYKRTADAYEHAISQNKETRRGIVARALEYDKKGDKRPRDLPLYNNNLKINLDVDNPASFKEPKNNAEASQMIEYLQSHTYRLAGGNVEIANTREALDTVTALQFQESRFNDIKRNLDCIIARLESRLNTL